MMDKVQVVRWGMVVWLLTAVALSGHAQTMVDNFNRSSLGPNWTADPAYVIVNNELADTSTKVAWGGYALFNALAGPTSVSVKWAPSADAAGIGQGAIAVMLDANSLTANGYMLFHYGSS
ncbi:MAG: hypothetical protein ACUVTG_11830, partial [Candidatus Oleimicrobiaceae bacterium]